MSRGQRLRHCARRGAGPVAALAICTVVLIGLQRLTASLDYHAVIKHLCHLPRTAVLNALAATVLSYVGLVGRDWAGLRAIGSRLPLPVLTLGAVTGSALGNAAGFGALTGGAVRYRIFGAACMPPEQIARLTVVTSATFGLGLVLMGGGGAALAADMLSRVLAVPASELRLGGIACLAAAAVCIAWTSWCGGRIRFRRFSIDMPRPGAILLQLALVGVDVVGAGLCLWALMPAAHVGLGVFLSLYCAALLLGVIAHTPGGIGVFDAAMLFTLQGSVPSSAAVAALLAYRAIYFGLPVLLSAGLLGVFETRAAMRWTRRNRLPLRGVSRLAPTFLGVVTFAIGVMLVISGATPAFTHRLDLLENLVPLWVLEGSQFLGSVLGVWLLFISRGLFRRLDAAWWLALGAAVISLFASLAKGLAFIEAGVLGFLILLLLATRHHFRRPASLFRQRLGPGWITAIAMVVVVSFWVFFFAFRKVPYSHDLWWQFEFDEKAPRALRATIAAALSASAIGLWQMLRVSPGKLAAPTALDLVDAERIVRSQERSDAMLAMAGDKNFLFSASRKAFLMYARRGRSWVALHDPVGPREEWRDLVMRFVALAHANGGRAAFYQVRPDSLPLYLDAGLRLLKLGEEARISLPEFALEGSRRANLRYALKRGERDGLSAEVVLSNDLPALVPSLEAISRAWMGGRQGREKGFSVAGFDPAWLRTQSVMLVRQHGEPVAFAAFMTTDLHTEATVGAMRHVPDASPYAMEYLFTRLALHLKQQGFATLSLGMAPLSGILPTPLARQWHKAAHLIWRYGGRVYNFQGLRSFKSKFQPAWEPRYLAASGNIGPFVALADVAVLASGMGA